MQRRASATAGSSRIWPQPFLLTWASRKTYRWEAKTSANSPNGLLTAEPIPVYTPQALSLAQPDPGVLRKAQRGDERAFSIILRAYETPVFNYVLRLVNGDRSLAEDLTQEVFLRVFQGLP
ncbi:MAG: hypothetical protein E6G15_01820, partial [Actinobacteria bacterium]